MPMGSNSSNPKWGSACLAASAAGATAVAGLFPARASARPRSADLERDALPLRATRGLITLSCVAPWCRSSAISRICQARGLTGPGYFGPYAPPIGAELRISAYRLFGSAFGIHRREKTPRRREQDSNHRSRVTRPIFQCRLWLVPANRKVGAKDNRHTKRRALPPRNRWFESCSLESGANLSLAGIRLPTCGSHGLPSLGSSGQLWSPRAMLPDLSKDHSVCARKPLFR